MKAMERELLGGVGMAWATFAVSGTMTGDIVRYVKTGGQAVGVTGVAFLFSNGPFMILGALFAAAINDPTVPYFLDTDGTFTLVALAAIAILSTWSTADPCLYNATLGFSTASRVSIGSAPGSSQRSWESSSRRPVSSETLRTSSSRLAWWCRRLAPQSSPTTSYSVEFTDSVSIGHHTPIGLLSPGLWRASAWESLPTSCGRS